VAEAAYPLESVSAPKQFRSERTLLRILAAAEALIAEKGIADASIPEIVRRAGSSVGGFYARFKDKTELLRALEERFFADVSQRLDALADRERWSGAPIPVIVRACVTDLVSVTLQRANLIAAFFSHTARDGTTRCEALGFQHRVSEKISQLLLERRGEIQHPQPELAIDLGVQFAFGLMFGCVVNREFRAAGIPLGEAELCREIERNFLCYLGVQTSPPQATSGAETACPRSEVTQASKIRGLMR